MGELWQLGAAEVAARVRAGETPATEVLDSCLERTAQVEEAVGAYLHLEAAEARQRAAEIDRRRERGERLGHLAGVPVALKDNICLRGVPLTCASRILEGFVCPYSATAVRRLEEADAVIVGKTNMDEFAMGSSCESSALQTTRNPWNLERVPGGSSGGSAAAVAAGSVPLALGSDTGGSIRQPAALCGVVGLKPTWGRVSRYGLVAFASSMDQIGPLARRVRDAALALGVMAGADPHDATSSSRPLDDYLEAMAGGIDGIKVGYLRQVEQAELPAAIRSNWERSLTWLQELGAELAEVSIPTLEWAIPVYYLIATSEASANLARFDGIRYGRRVGGDDLVESYCASRAQGLGREVKRRIMLGTFALSSGYYDAYYGRARRMQEAMRRELSAAFEKVDVLVAPTSPTAAFGRGEKLDDPLAMYLCDVFTTPASLVGIPALAVPSGRDDDGLPLSLQIMVPHFQEAAAARVARAFEERVDQEVGSEFPLD